MHHDEAKKIINEILENEVRFDGHFDKCFDNLKETIQEEIIIWIQDCKQKKIGPIQSKTDKEIIGFVKRIGSNFRAILTKEKKGYFISLFIDKHKYYETEMNKLGF